MTVNNNFPSGPVSATLNFFSPPLDPNEKPYNLVTGKQNAPNSRNFSDESHTVQINDARGREDSFALDKHAFTILRNQPESAETEFLDDDKIKERYYPEVEKLLLDQVDGAKRVYLFDHTIRRSDPEANRGPVQLVHIDQTAKSTEKRVRTYYTPEESDALLAGRYRIINVWRPLNTKPVESFPLAFASSATLRDEDLVPVELRYPSGYNGETAGIKHHEDQEWWYLSGMTGDERLLLECFDSESLKEGSVIGGRVPHTAFHHPGTKEGAEGRESIEVRALVFDR